ncbi:MULTISPECIES: DUF4258 domain-containing protein [Zobellia]|uniref:Conserved hypothetical membrane protein n=1 Tax=Zobellia galactanivorans (strain DSM 12802 / CCUG 47099 / CIP 106680 / NCIMB 13871 / Dsij) TaxID=63186 RepID=G0L6V4_ZOBGA|nr:MULTISPECIES: DUF4258 domain-containing protein [Zobellia]MBU3025754.1 DUF4258 domain-containing protein [Zobellia galactanivorans]OWW25981.1 hypothetical protein B4Q04_10395 [Zobellia sp. OII3]CAZ98669.1 Conserved hypothetical membrane protein [Zobellia galactanivorans]
MDFLKRLGFYLVGLSIGIVFLTFFLKKKSEETGTEFCYFPNCRTLKDIRSKPMSYSDKVSQLFLEKKIDTLDILDVLRNGDVDFSNSETKTTPCKTYIIEGSIKEREAILKIRNCREKALLESISYP